MQSQDRGGPREAPLAPQNKTRVGVQGTEGREGGHSTGDTTTGDPRARWTRIAPPPREPRHRHTRAWTRSPPARTHA